MEYYVHQQSRLNNSICIALSSSIPPHSSTHPLIHINILFIKLTPAPIHPFPSSPLSSPLLSLLLTLPFHPPPILLSLPHLFLVINDTLQTLLAQLSLNNLFFDTSTAHEAIDETSPLLSLSPYTCCCLPLIRW